MITPFLPLLSMKLRDVKDRLDGISVQLNAKEVGERLLKIAAYEAHVSLKDIMRDVFDEGYTERSMDDFYETKDGNEEKYFSINGYDFHAVRFVQRGKTYEEIYVDYRLYIQKKDENDKIVISVNRPNWDLDITYFVNGATTRELGVIGYSGANFSASDSHLFLDDVRGVRIRPSIDDVKAICKKIKLFEGLLRIWLLQKSDKTMASIEVGIRDRLTKLLQF